MKAHLPILAFLLAGALPAPAIYLGPPAVYESAAEQKSNLAKSRNLLSSLQKAAKECTSIQLGLVHSSYAFLPKPVEIPLSEYDQKQLRYLVSRMRAVKNSSAGSPKPEHVTRLVFLGPDKQVLARLDTHEVTTDNLVNAQGYASGARLSLSADDAAAWYACIKPEQAREIARQPNPARVPSGRRRSRVVKRPEPEPPSTPQVEFPQQEYHTNCDHKHGKHHKHKSKNHWCTHHH